MSESKKPHHNNPQRHTDGQHRPRRHGNNRHHSAKTRGRGHHTQHPRRQRRPILESAAPFQPFTPEQLAARVAAIPVITFPDLPVSARKDDIAQAIRDNQVVIVAGETGSGKTTQLPKIALQLGRGINGMIGHTQPRRLAAHAVASRIADELGQKVSKESGNVVGYQVRFTDHVGPTTLIKLMTDGILLAEIQSDPMLHRYDTLIIDEAHERSLNIDFILGYLARLLPLRPDLKVIITSATIDSARFAQHFGRWESDTGHHVPPGQGRLISAAPVIEVSGRTYPVEIRYRPLSADLPSQWTSESTHSSTNASKQKTFQPDTPESLNPTDNNHPFNTSPHFQQLVLEDPDDDLPTLGYGMGEDIDQETAIAAAVDELIAEGPGDILIFLPGERDIRDVQQALTDHLGPRAITSTTTSQKNLLPHSVEIIPLYARLTAAEQQRIFEPHSLRRIVLATNVAETSLTVPGIRYVIDPGLARISRYSNKTKVQRLPIESISQASANQRAGRSGRLEDGVTIRLYSQRDYENRPAFTEPEILRTSLASVILQMSALGLGSVEDFPFLDAPDPRAVRDGVQLLVEIGALEYPRALPTQLETPAQPAPSDKIPATPQTKAASPRRADTRLTAIGRDLARLPIDPRLGRMLLEADDNGAASEVLIIVAALSLQDVRERPLESQSSADAAHARFTDPHSDFITYLNLWRYLSVQQRDLSGSQFRKMCRTEFLHYLRWREWRDIVNQLTQLAKPLDLNIHPIGEPSAADVVHAAQTGGVQDAAARAVVAYTASHRTVDADQIHRSLLVGLLSNLGSWDEKKRDYEGARGTHFTIWPGSGLARSHPSWVMTAELVETSRLFARTVACIDPDWIEPVAGALVKRVYSEPFWSSSKGAALVKEKVILYGLTVSADRPVLLGRVPVLSGEATAGRSSVAKPGSLAGIAQGLLGGHADSAGGSAFSLRAREALTGRELAREMFIRHALIHGEWREVHRFQKDNDARLEQAREVERRSRTHGLVADEEARFAFFDDILPANIISARHFNQWWKTQRHSEPNLLTYPMELLLPRGTGEDSSSFPDSWLIHEGWGQAYDGTPVDERSIVLPLSYQFAPGSQRDGVTITIPVELLERVTDRGCDWLVPGLFDELVTEYIRALPKAKRRLLAPAPEVGSAVAQWIRQNRSHSGALISANANSPHADSSADAEDPMSLGAAMDRLAAWGAKTGQTRQLKNSARNTPTAFHGASPHHAHTVITGQKALESQTFAAWFCQGVRHIRGVELTHSDCESAYENLAPHLLMTFVVVDRSGKELASGTSLPYLQKTLATQADTAIRSAVRGALAQALQEAGIHNPPASNHGSHNRQKKAKADPASTQHGQHAGGKTSTIPSTQAPSAQVQGHAVGVGVSSVNLHLDQLTAFPEHPIPRHIDSVGAGGLPLRGYPGLVAQGSAAEPFAGVRVVANPAQADRNHRLGLAYLLDRYVSLSQTRVTTRWTGRQAAMLAASPYSSTADLVADAQLASALSLVDDMSPHGDPSNVRDVDAFELLAVAARNQHEDRVYDILLHTIRALEAYAEVQGSVSQYASVASLKLVVRDVKRVMKTLVYPGFISATPAYVMPHLARYLRALSVRLQRAAQGGADRDLQHLAVVEQLEIAVDDAREAAADRPFDARVDQQLTATSWMIHELRVSLFAQILGTPQKVSAKRVRAMLAQLH